MKPGSPLASFVTGVAMFLLLWLLAAALINRPILPSPLIVLPLFGRLLLAERRPAIGTMGLGRQTWSPGTAASP